MNTRSKFVRLMEKARKTGGKVAMGIGLASLPVLGSAQPVDPTTHFDFSDMGFSAATIASAIILPALVIGVLWTLARHVNKAKAQTTKG